VKLRTALALTVILFTGCTVGPNHKLSALAIPPTFRAPEPLHADQSASLAELKWFEVFKDDRLQALIRRALVQNYDLREAVARSMWRAPGL